MHGVNDKSRTTGKLNLLATAAFTLLSAPALAGSAPRINATANDTDRQVRALYRQLITAENAHDIEGVRRLLWDSPATLFVAKTATAAEGGWAGFWGTETVLAHISELFRGTFVMQPDYSREKVVTLTPNVAEIYVPLTISVSYAGQSGTPQPFLMIVTWVKRRGEWKMATDIAVPIPAQVAH